MELKELVTNITKKRKIIILTSVMGILIGVIVYIIPPKYIASGSLYVVRKTENINEDTFTYEGYYAQQTAQETTNSIIALLESIDIRKSALENLKIETNEQNLRKARKAITVKKPGPQVITLEIKMKNEQEAMQYYNSLTDSLIYKTQELNNEGDEKIKVIRILDNPIVKQTYKSIFVFTVTGFLFGSLLGTFWGVLTIYFKKGLFK